MTATRMAISFSTTDAVKAAIIDKLDEQQDGLDRLHGLKQVTVIVVLNEHTGVPLRVLTRTECQNDLVKRR